MEPSSTRRARLWLAAILIAWTAVPGRSADAQPRERVQQLLRDAAAHFRRAEYREAVRLLETIPDDVAPPQRFDKHLALAQSLNELRRHAETQRHLDAASGIAERDKDLRRQTQVEIVRGSVYITTGQRAKHVAATRKAVDLARRAGDPRLIASAYRNRVRSFQDLEDWEQMIVTTDKALSAVADPAQGDRYFYKAATGIAYYRLGERDRAEAQFNEALGIAKAMGNKRGEGTMLSYLALIYWDLDRNAEHALQASDRALALAAEIGAPHLERIWLLNKANVWRDVGAYESAIRAYERVIALEDAKAPDDATWLAPKNLAMTRRIMGQPRAALPVLERLLASAGSAPLRIQWDLHLELATTYAELGMRAQAGEHYRRTLQVLEEERRSAILASSRTGKFAFSLDRKNPYERYVGFLASAGADAGIAAETFQLSEQARARGFLEMLRSVQASVTEAAPAALLDEEDRVMQRISDTQGKLRDASLDKREREALLAGLSQLEAERDRVRIRLRVEHPQLSETRYPELAPTDRLRAALAPREIVVAYLLGESSSYRWVIQRDAVALRVLAPRDEIQARGRRLLQVLRTPGDREGVARHAAALATAILDGIEIPEGSSIVVIPDGVLNYVPFEILPAGQKLLIERAPVAYGDSLNSLVFLRGLKSDDREFRMLSVGNPKMDRVTLDAAGGVRAAGIDTVALLAPLPHAKAELRAVGRNVGRGATQLLGAEARESALASRDLGRFRVLHFATHAFVDERRPTRSALVLSREQAHDGLLQVPEIYRLKLNADLVVLSACQTGLGAQVTGEGVVGLTRAFFFAGARSVVASLWNLNDAFASEFVDEFYRHVVAGRRIDEALRLTKLAYLAHPRYSHPYYWSTFVVRGDASRPIEITATRAYAPWVVVLAVVSALPAALVGVRRRARARRPQQYSRPRADRP